MTHRPDASKHSSFLVLFAPIAIVASLVGLRAAAQGLSVGNPALPSAVEDAGAPPVASAAPDSGSAPIAQAQAEDEADDDSAESSDGADDAADFDGKIPSITALADYPEAQDLLAHAHPGPDGRYWSERDGKPVPLSIDAKLQQKIEALLKSYAPPYAAVAAIEPATGKVLALAQYSRSGVKQLGLRAVYPAASVFKVVTAAALLEKGVDPQKQVCFHGGKHRIQPKLLENSTRDRTCYDMGEAMAKSANVVFAKLAHQNLTPELLRAEAGKFGFNRAMDFDQPVEKSAANIPDTDFEFATTAAGFGQVFLSPLHGALLAATVGNGGTMPAPTLLADAAVGRGRAVLEPKVAARIAEMMGETVSVGTARRAFRERGRPVLRGIEVAGKTGSLDDRKPFHDYTWFVGFAPKDHPTIAVAAVVVNDLIWRVRAPYIARETLRYYLADDSKPAAPVHHRRYQARR